MGWLSQLGGNHDFLLFLSRSGRDIDLEPLNGGRKKHDGHEEDDNGHEGTNEEHAITLSVKFL